MFSTRCDFAIVHNNDSIGVLYGADALCNDDFGCVRDKLGKGFLDGSIRFGINSRSGIVQNQNLWFFQQSAGDTKPLLLTTRDVASALLDIGIVLVREALNELICTGQAAGYLDFFIRGAFIAQRRFSLIVPENSSFFCSTMATALRNTSKSYLRTSTPPNNI